MPYKCHTCKTIVEEKPCPKCGEVILEPMCINDHICICTEEITSGIHYCSICGKPCCPCGSEDVFQLSRVTGYYANVESFNESKKQELKDRQRYNFNL